MSAGFHRTGLMDIDMSRDSAEHALVLAKCCIDHCDIGLGPTYQEMDCQAVIPSLHFSIVSILFASLDFLLLKFSQSFVSRTLTRYSHTLFVEDMLKVSSVV